MQEAIEAIKPDVAEMTADEFIAVNLPKITPESFKRETGLSGSEQRQLVGVIAGADKGGVTIEQAAEIIYENYIDELQGLGFNGDVQDIRNTIIGILSGGNPRSYAKNSRKKREAENVEQQRIELEGIAKVLHFDTIGEQIAYEETVIPRIIRDYKDFDEIEYYNNLAKNYENDTTRESESTGRGSELLQGEQTADNTGTGDITEPGQRGEVQGDVYIGGENGTPQGKQQVNEPVGEADNQSEDNLEMVAEGGNAPGNGGVPVNEEVGPFGRIYRQFKGMAKEAIQFLLGKKEGEAVGALSHPEIGDIDLVWGEEGTSNSDGYGLAKLAKYHPEVLENLQEIINDMRVTKRSANRVQLESDTHQAAVRLTWDNQSKNWLLTAFEKKNSVSDNTTDTGETSDGGKQNDTATLQNTVSADESTTQPATLQENAQKSSEIAENGGENSTLEQINAELGPLSRDNAAEYARRLFAVSPWKTLEEANTVLKELLASYGETLSGQTLGVVPFLDEARNLIIDNDIAELEEQNRVADERQQRIGLPPRVSDYSKAITEGDAEAMKEWEGGFNDYMSKLLPADIPALDSTIRGMQGNKDAIKTGDPKGYKENPNYKAFDYIEKALKKRKRELEESSINGEKSQEIEEKSTNDGAQAEQAVSQNEVVLNKGAKWERTGEPEKMKSRSKKKETKKKYVTLQQNLLDLFDNGTEENTRTDNSGAQSESQKLPNTEQVGARTSVQHPAKNSESKRGNSGTGRNKLGDRPQYDVNKNYSNEEIGEIVSSITDIVDGKVVIAGEVTDDIKAIIRGYKSGGVAKQGRGILDEYYTDGKIVDAVNMLITPYFKGAKGVRVLEPSVGVGNFIEAVNNIPTSEIQAFEINDTTARIAKILYPDIDVNLRSFETEFIDESGNKKTLPKKFNLVIGNPPYGSHRGLYKGLGEESKIARYEDYFVKRSLDVLSDGGVLAMVLPSSWIDRHTKYGGYTIEAAYRLPSGAFEATQVGTDIVILKKDSTIPVTEHTPYFEQHPERVLGDVKERTGRYGRTEQYVEGNIDTALETIKREHAEQLAEQLDIEKSNDNLNDIEAAIEETGSIEKATPIVESEKAERKPAKKSSKPSKYKVELNRGVETVSTSSQFTHEFSEGEVKAFADTEYDGTLNNPTRHKKYANYIGGRAVHDFYYAEGDIYDKLAQLEREKGSITEAYGIEQYNKQKRLLESVLPKRKGLSEITVSPNTTFVKNLNIETAEGSVSLKDAFIVFCRKLPHQAFGDSSPWEVVRYVNNEQVHETDKHRNQRVRERRKRVANDLFAKFLNEELSDKAKNQVVAAFNSEYNSVYRPDYSKVPMFSTINKIFKDKPLKLTDVQLAGIGRMTVKGVGVLAHEVGFGKTLSGILAMHEAMTRGFAKKPLIVVPNDNILKQWVETINEVLPQATVNTLGNLGTGYDLTDFKVNDGEFTIVTYEGLKAMSFSDDTYNRLADRFSYITEDLKKHQSERDIQKEIEKHNELRGKMKRGAKATYGFEDFGFDWLTVDEVHNANHIVSKVRLDKSVASDFRSQRQRTSDLGLKTWLAAQYIQEENNGRNVLLLSATPFTNKPLEYYSILSLVGNKMLERKGFFNVDQFFATFMEADNEMEMGANNRPVQKTNVRRFRNNGLFQQLLSEFVDIKGEEDNPELIRPTRHNREYKLAQNDLTAEAIDAAQVLLNDNDTVLQGIGHARAAAFSPYATSLLGAHPKNHKEFVKNSPKIDATIKMIEQNRQDRPDAGQIIYSEVGVEFFPMIRDYLVKESGFKPNEVRIITGATSNNERVNIQTAFNKGEVKVVIGSPAIKEGLNLQGNTTDMYILSLPWNFTQLRQIEGRGWRQGNKWENIRINYMLTNNSVDVFQLQRLQLKQGLYNEAMKSGAESLDVSDIDTAELKTALITDPAVRAEIVTAQEREKLQMEKTQIEADLSFVVRKYEAYNKLISKLDSQKRTVKQYREWAKNGDKYWVERAEREEAVVQTIEQKIEQEKENLAKRGVNVDDIVRQTEQAQSAIAAIQERIDNLKEFQQELTERFRKENEAKEKLQGDVLATYLKERKAENNSGFYKIRPKEKPKTAKEGFDKVGDVTMPELGENGMTMHAVDVTPEMQESVMQGQKMFRSVGGNSGYVGYSMSKRAAEAREEGRFPKTDFKKEYGLNETTFNALVDAGIIESGEWHHTSKYGNKTAFYGWAEEGFAEFYTENKKLIDNVAKGKNADGSLFIEDVKENPYKEVKYPIPDGYWEFLRSLENAGLSDALIQAAVKERFPELVEASDNNRLFYDIEAANNAIKYKNKKLIADKLSDLFDENVAMFRMGSRVDARMAEVASELDARELSPEQRAVADVFGGKADNLTISVKTQDGNERKVVMRQGNEAHAGTKHSLYRHYNTGSGAITTDDILLIPEVIANGERTENGKKAVYKHSIDGVEYTVITENNKGREEFANFYTNRKASPSARKTRSEEARASNGNASADKGNTKSANEQAIDEILSQQDSDEVAMTKGAINSLGEKLNTPIKILEDTTGLDEREKKAKGWYDTKTGEVVIVLPNNISLDDAIETVLHELVGHKGLRAVMGEEFDSFLDFVYENATPEMKRDIKYRFLSSIREGRTMTLRECTEEYIASLAERGFDGYSGVWNAIKQWLRDFFRRFTDVNVSDGELRYLLWKSYNRLQRGPIAQIEDIAMEAKTNTGNRANRFREVTTDGLKKRYDERVEGIWNRFKEGWIDGTRSMRVAQAIGR